ncbi:hypothetical protein HMI55_007382 [Coelomomyces lativittatus]|nr:hypothetical protein HMI55_007382 [Coelomomyces lativittatus]
MERSLNDLHHSSSLSSKRNPPKKEPPSNFNGYLFLGLVLFRIWNAWVVCTFFVPDEYWQCLEIAYKLVFGQGQVTWEWLPNISIRGYLHPWLFVPVYTLLRALDWNTTELLEGSVQSFLLLLLLFFFFGFSHPQYFLSFCMMGFTVLVRPPSAVLFLIHTWFYFPWHPGCPTWVSSMQRRRCGLALLMSLVTVLSMSLILDTWGVRRLFPTSTLANPIVSTTTTTSSFLVHSPPVLFAPYQFLRFNVLHHGSAFYGVHPFHWYWTSGLPSVLGSFYFVWVWPWHGRGWRRGAGFPGSLPLKAMVVGTIGVFSMLSHKELRFLLDVYPLLMIGVGQGLVGLRHRCTSTSSRHGCRWGSFRQWLVWITLVQAFMAGFFSRWHQRGNLDLMAYVRQRPGHLFAMVPCHTVPGYAYFGHVFKLHGLTCQPPPFFPQPNEETLFYLDPHTQLSQWDWESRWQFHAPDYVVVFDVLWKKYNQTGVLLDYHECARFFYSYFTDDPRREGDLLLLCSNTNTTTSTSLSIESI